MSANVSSEGEEEILFPMGAKMPHGLGAALLVISGNFLSKELRKASSLLPFQKGCRTFLFLQSIKCNRSFWNDEA